MEAQENELLYSINSLVIRFMERVANLESQVNAFYKEFIEYVEHNPKIDEQWAEQRIRALEHQVKEIRDDLDEEIRGIP